MGAKSATGLCKTIVKAPVLAVRTDQSSGGQAKKSAGDAPVPATLIVIVGVSILHPPGHCCHNPPHLNLSRCARVCFEGISIMPGSWSAGCN